MARNAMPAELRTERLYFRPWRSSDALHLRPVLEANVEHLGPWIPRSVAEPVPLVQLGARLAGFAAAFEEGREWRYAIFATDEESIYGEVSLFPRNSMERVPLAGADRVEIGYWLRADCTGRGIATEAVRVMLRAARSIPGISRAEIRCDADNAPSAAVPRRLGFQLSVPVRDGTMIWYRDLAEPAKAQPADV